MKLKLLYFVLLVLPVCLQAQVETQVLTLENLSTKYKSKENAEQKKLQQLTKKYKWEKVLLSENSNQIITLTGVDVQGFPIYTSTNNNTISAATKNKVKVSMKTHGVLHPEAINHNVVGELIGSEFPNKFITIGGHLDSWDVGEGAHDDGTGCVQTMELLRVFKAMNYKPKHSIRFVLFANEENGLKGGNKYADEAVAKKEDHIFSLESDAGGFTPRGFTFKMSDEQLVKIQSWKKLLKPYGTEKLEKGGGGADIGPLNEKLKTPVSGFSPDGQRYFDFHHTDNDIFEFVNRRELLLGAVNMAALIYLVDKYGL